VVQPGDLETGDLIVLPGSLVGLVERMGFE
jgi:hypothetical protein